MTERFLITGADGFLGKKVFDLLRPDHKVAGVDIKGESNPRVERLDITKRKELESFFQRFAPTVVFHAAAISSPDECEKNPRKAKKVNVQGTVNIVEVSREYGAKVIFTSSLHVYDGKRGNFSEADITNPINVYGETKLNAERVVLQYPSNIILRLGTLYGYNGYDGTQVGAVVEIIESLRRGKKYKGLVDVYRNFTLIDDFRDGILILLEKQASGVFNFCSFETYSDYRFVLAIARVFGFSEDLIRRGRAKPFYPKNSTMLAEKIVKLGIYTHSLEEGLRVVKKQINGFE